MMVNFLLVCLSSVGLTHIIVDSSIFNPIRNFITQRENIVGFGFLSKIITCYQCCGMWAGVFCGWIIFQDNLSLLLLYGFIGSFLSSFAAIIFNYLEAQTVMSVKDE